MHYLLFICLAKTYFTKRKIYRLFIQFQPIVTLEKQKEDFFVLKLNIHFIYKLIYASLTYYYYSGIFENFFKQFNFRCLQQYITTIRRKNLTSSNIGLITFKKHQTSSYNWQYIFLFSSTKESTVPDQSINYFQGTFCVWISIYLFSKYVVI